MTPVEQFMAWLRGDAAPAPVGDQPAPETPTDAPQTGATVVGESQPPPAPDTPAQVASYTQADMEKAIADALAKQAAQASQSPTMPPPNAMNMPATAPSADKQYAGWNESDLLKMTPDDIIRLESEGKLNGDAILGALPADTIGGV